MSWPGRARASAISSFTFFTGSDGVTTRISGLVAERWTAAKSLVRSGKVFFSIMTEVMSVCVVMSSVWPSGALRATSSPAIWLLAPGRFSTTTDWPSDSLRLGARSRATMSVAPPGAKPTSIRTVLTGNFGACASADPATARHNAPAIHRKWFMFPPREMKRVNALALS
ncbi:hypothetical protein D3C83_15120 [compost metagenome]